MSKTKIYTSERELVEACAKGEASAIDAFYEKFHKLVYHAIHGWLKSHALDDSDWEDIPDIFQEIFVELMKNEFALAMKARNPEKHSALIFIAAIQTTGRYFKRKWIERDRTGKLDYDPCEEDDIIEKLQADEIIHLIGEFVNTLNPARKQVFELRFRDNLDYAEIAEELNISVSNVGVVVNRLKKKLVQFICNKNRFYRLNIDERIT